MGDFDKDRRQNDVDIAGIVLQIAEIRADISELKEGQEAQANATAALIEAWNTGTGLVKFIKWLAGVSISIATIWAAFHFDFNAMVDNVLQSKK